NKEQTMLKRILLLTVGIALLSARQGAAQSAMSSAPLTTQQAYESWTAWYRLHAEAKADDQGPRYRQLLAAADGDQYFLKGLDSPSRQVVELSKQGLTQSFSDDTMVALFERSIDPRTEVASVAREVLSAIVMKESPVGGFVLKHGVARAEW